MELRDRPGLPGLGVLEVEGPHQVVVAPHVLRHQVNLENGRLGLNFSGQCQFKIIIYTMFSMPTICYKVHQENVFDFGDKEL